jgi:hypothetical protein
VDNLVFKKQISFIIHEKLIEKIILCIRKGSEKSPLQVVTCPSQWHKEPPFSGTMQATKQQAQLDLHHVQ